MYDLGYNYALRWDNWDSKTCGRYETAMGDLYGWHNYRRGQSSWYSGFGSRQVAQRRPYFIYVRNEAMLTAAMLRVTE